MKKTLIILSAIASLASGAASAKTEGNYVGVDVLRASANNKYQISGQDTAIPEFSDSSIGYGINYKYAFNSNNFFVAPGIFFDKLGTEAKGNSNDTVSANYRYGFTTNIGYDITDDFAAYITGGLAKVNTESDFKSFGMKRSSNDIGYVVGAGLSYKVAKNMLVNFEYNYQTVNANSPFPYQVESNISVAKVGVAFNF